MCPTRDNIKFPALDFPELNTVLELIREEAVKFQDYVTDTAVHVTRVSILESEIEQLELALEEAQEKYEELAAVNDTLRHRLRLKEV